MITLHSIHGLTAEIDTKHTGSGRKVYRVVIRATQDHYGDPREGHQAVELYVRSRPALEKFAQDLQLELNGDLP